MYKVQGSVWKCVGGVCVFETWKSAKSGEVKLWIEEQHLKRDLKTKKYAHSSRRWVGPMFVLRLEGNCAPHPLALLIVVVVFVCIIGNGKWICGYVWVCVCSYWPCESHLNEALPPSPSLPIFFLLRGLRSLFVGVDSAWADSVGWFC